MGILTKHVVGQNAHNLIADMQCMTVGGQDVGTIDCPTEALSSDVLRGSVDPLASLSQHGLGGRGELIGVDWALTPPPSDSIGENDEVVGTTTS